MTIIIGKRLQRSEGALPSQQPAQSVAELAKLLQNELFDLSQQDEALRKLARGLALLLRALQKDASGEILPTRMGESFIPLVRTPEWSRRKITNRMRRACRIALMERDEAATVDEIHLRIAQRGSFHFDNAYQAAAAIRQTLNLMTEQGEAQLVDTNLRPRWKRTNAPDLEIDEFSVLPARFSRMNTASSS